MAEFKQQVENFEKLGARICPISSDSLEPAQGFAAEMALPFALLCDPERQVITAYGLLNPYEHGGVAHPAILVIDRDQRLIYRSIDNTVKRIDLQDLLDFLAQRQHDPSLQKEASRKHFIFPNMTTYLQIMKNMFKRGNSADWKHYFLFPLELVQMLRDKKKR